MHWTEIAQRRVGDVVIVDLHGQMTLTGEEAPRLLQTIRRIVSEGGRTVLLNLTHVSYVDSTGIGEIAGASNFSTACSFPSPEPRFFTTATRLAWAITFILATVTVSGHRCNGMQIAMPGFP